MYSRNPPKISSSSFTEIKQLMEVPSLPPFWGKQTCFKLQQMCVHQEEEGGICAVQHCIFSFEILSVVWFRLRYVFVLWSYVDTEYNIWKAIVSTACADLGFILFGGLCSSSNLNIMCSNVLEDFFITTLSHMLLDHRRLFC